MFMSYLSLSALPAGILFALVATITPGPNNTMLLASGVNFGFRRTLPHVSGISAGVVLLMLSVGIGLGEAFVHFPMLYTVLEVASVAYLLYLAWKIGTSGELKLRNGDRRPMKFHEAIVFQWVNPKAWMMVLTAATTIHVSESASMNAIAMAVIFYVIGFPCICLWAGFGTAMRKVLSDPKRLRIFNVAMALLLVLSLYPIALKLLGQSA
ncbi:lysine transporter LysE [Paraburkholderia caffeinilytica]|uniref:Lysine transporter LysE n=2 Tax=Paraburkholderia caffeinilytica TaxID=1761016 RepID=A0ABQ1N642_9BURK|nr:lysine transporter LysE [Paraburkholderia caffeinilytica]GGC55248.1 lysine transporter LysE [Paraburkholderia caffeinilytica]CAB3785230.1 Cysteine/O-acetylserine efflux protein [Paraburkholderia caffeinilytica]